jgi:dTDP-glucose 4,6-dehydratase
LTEINNLDLAIAICTLLDERRPRAGGRHHTDRIQFVPDRPGRDHRLQSMRQSKTGAWLEARSLQTGLSKTVDWYLDHMDWTMDDNSWDRLGPKPIDPSLSAE